MMNAEELIKNGQPAEALAALQQAIRDKPEDPKLRIFAFQLMSLLGQWERALTQLQTVASMKSASPDHNHLATVFGPAIQCEAFRKAVFEGKRSPLIFGEPEPWMGQLLQAHQLAAEGKFDAAEDLRNQAFEAAPTTPGKRGESSFEWMADADTRMGPMLEVILNAKYYWVPFCRIKVMSVQPPMDLRDLVWANVQFVWTNGGEATGLVPARYPGTEASSDDALRMSRKTEWVEHPGGQYWGSGQRLLTTDQEDIPLLELQRVEFEGDGTDAEQAGDSANPAEPPPR